MTQKINTDATLTEIEICRAAVADPSAGMHARNYARGYLALNDAAWLAEHDRPQGNRAPFSNEASS
jgi:hypothetical protein